MEIKAILKKPCTPEQIELFKVENSHRKSYDIVQTEEEYQAWGKTQEELEAEQLEQVGNLNMTRGDFFEGLILAQGKDEEDVMLLIDTLDITDIEKKVYKNRVKNALNFYRKYPLVDLLGAILNLDSTQLDAFFRTGDYNCLKKEDTDANI